MKYISKFAFTIILSLTLFACNQGDTMQENPVNLKGMNLKLNIDFSKGTFMLDKGIDVFAKEMTNYIYDDNIDISVKISSFNIRKYKNELLINIPKTKYSNLQQKVYLAPCKTLKKTCRSKACVQKTLEKILGDGSRDVNITYRRNTFSVTIEYTYQDC